MWGLRRREKEDRRPAPLMWMPLREEEKVKVRHVSTADCQGILPGKVVSLREEEKEVKEAKEAMEEKVDIRTKGRERVKDEEKVTKEIAGIVGRMVTNQQSVGM